jgi:hypothetical protein
MDEKAFRTLRTGDRVVVEYLGERHEATVVESVYGDRWQQTIVVEFESGAVWAPTAEQVIRRAEAAGQPKG